MVTRFLRLAVDERAVSWQVMVPVTLAFMVGSLASGLLAAVIVWGLLAAAQRWVMRRRLVQRHITLAVLITLAAVASASWIAGAALATEPSLADVLWRTVAVLLLTATWSSLDDYRTALADERALQATLAVARTEGLRRVQAQRDDVVGEVSRMLETALEGADDAGDATGRLRELARDRIRPLSHELAEALPRYVPERPELPREAAWRTVARSILGAPLIRPLLTAVLVTVLYVLTTTTTVSSSDRNVTPDVEQPIGGPGLVLTVDATSALWSLLYLAMVFGTTWLVGIAAFRWTGPLIQRCSLVGRVAVVLSTLVLMALLVQVVIEVAYRAPGSATSDAALGTRLVATAPIFLVAFVLLIVRATGDLFASVLRREQDLSAQLAWESARAQETLLQERRFLAGALHGSLQSTVAAAALGLEESRNRRQDAGVAWERIHAQLLSAVRALADGPPARRDLPGEVAAIASTWAGLCEVEISIDPGLQARLDDDWVSAGTVSDVLAEATANAVMHGQATRVRADITEAEGATMRIVVVNDGQAVRPGAEQGLGSRSLDEVTISWFRDSGPEGTRLEAVLPAPLTGGPESRADPGTGGLEAVRLDAQ